MTPKPFDVISAAKDYGDHLVLIEFEGAMPTDQQIKDYMARTYPGPYKVEEITKPNDTPAGFNPGFIYIKHKYKTA